MRHTFCPDCGTRLTGRVLGDEGFVPWCEGCSRPWFDAFSTCIIAAVMNQKGEVLLQRERRRPDREVLVAGYIKPGESAEDTARREIAEETGLTATTLQYMGSWPTWTAICSCWASLQRPKASRTRIQPRSCLTAGPQWRTPSNPCGRAALPSRWLWRYGITNDEEGASLPTQTPPPRLTACHLPYEGEAQLPRLSFVGALSPQGD